MNNKLSIITYKFSAVIKYIFHHFSDLKSYGNEKIVSVDENASASTAIHEIPVIKYFDLRPQKNEGFGNIRLPHC